MVVLRGPPRDRHLGLCQTVKDGIGWDGMGGGETTRKRERRNDNSEGAPARNGEVEWAEGIHQARSSFFRFDARQNDKQQAVLQGQSWSWSPVLAA